MDEEVLLGDKKLVPSEYQGGRVIHRIHGREKNPLWEVGSVSHPGIEYHSSRLSCRLMDEKKFS